MLIVRPGVIKQKLPFLGYPRQIVTSARVFLFLLLAHAAKKNERERSAKSSRFTLGKRLLEKRYAVMTFTRLTFLSDACARRCLWGVRFNYRWGRMFCKFRCNGENIFFRICRNFYALSCTHEVVYRYACL